MPDCSCTVRCGDTVVLTTACMSGDPTAPRPFLPLTVEYREYTAASGRRILEAVRAGEDMPLSKKTLRREEISRLSYGQDTPALLESMPSMTWYSDSGGNTNYSYFSLRGIHQSRINLTLDGAPLNDPAENALYFNNFGGFAGYVDSIQIQRGVGTSTVGSGVAPEAKLPSGAG